MGVLPEAHESPQRLVKVWLPVDDIRQMDQLIRDSKAYAGRDEFVLEALRDRIREETVGRQAGAARPHLVEEVGATEEKVVQLGHWQARAVRTAGPVRLSRPLNGLHNRDYPTLWAADLLALWTATRGEPVAWMTFVGRISSSAWTYAGELAADDEARPLTAMKAAVGFPRNKDLSRRVPSEQRFIDHMVGTVRQGRPDGPLFGLGLVGLLEDEAVAPTKSALKLLKELAKAGVIARPPHPPAAWMAFRNHLAKHLPEDIEIMRRLLSAVSQQPTTHALVGFFADEWSGAVLQTNVGGFTARCREWGLVEPKLVDGKYRLTELGEAELAGRF